MAQIRDMLVDRLLATVSDEQIAAEVKRRRRRAARLRHPSNVREIADWRVEARR